MKTVKKVLALLLCAMLLLGAIAIPVSAEETTEYITKYISLLDLSAATVGVKQTGVPEGIPNIEAFTAPNNIKNSFAGNQEIIENEDGTKSWKIYFDTKTKDGGYLSDYSGNMVSVKLAIPTAYANLVSGIKLDAINGVAEDYYKVDGTSTNTTADQLYGLFGISDGTNYSGFGQTGSADYSALGTATQEAEYSLEKNVDDLYIHYAVRSDGTTNRLDQECNGTKADKRIDKYTYGTEIAYVYLVMTCRRCAGTEGSFAIINDIGINVKATAEEFAAIEAAIERENAYNSLLITDWEGNGVESDLAVSGTKVASYPTSVGYKGGPSVTLNTFEGYADYDGLSFWAYNGGEGDADIYIVVYSYDSEGTRTRFVQGFTIPEKSWKKCYLSYSCLTKQTEEGSNKSDDWYANPGYYISNYCMTEAEREGITSIKFVNRNRSVARQFWFDDLSFVDHELASRDEIVFTSDNVTGATVNEDGQIVIPAHTKDEHIVEIDVPKGTLKDASNLYYNFTSNSTANVKIMVYVDNTIIESTGKEGFIKKGEKGGSDTLTSGGTATIDFDFHTTSTAGGNRVYTGSERWFLTLPAEGNQYISADRSRFPTPYELAEATTICVRVPAFGTPAEEGTEVTDYITLDSLSVLKKGSIATVAAVEGGEVVVSDTRVIAGTKSNFIVNTKSCYELESLTIVDANGNNVEYTKGDIYSDTNLDDVYTFTAPLADYTITPVFTDNHNYSTVTVDATCTTAGSVTKTCTECGTVKTEEIKATGHSYESVTTEPDCGHAGVTVYTCTNCKDTYSEEIPKTGDHNYSSVETVAPTCTEEGEMTFTCGVCGDTYTEEIKATGHTEVVDEAVAPTCTETGLTEGSHCKVCDTVFVAQETVDATGHKFEDGSCVCGLLAEAGVEGEWFETFEEAVAAANDNDTVILLTDAVLEAKLTINKDITLNLNGKTLTTYAVNDNYDVIISADVVITGDGAVNINGIYGIGVQAAGSLVIENGTFTDSATTDYLIGSWGTVTVNGGTFNAGYCAVNAFSGSAEIVNGTFLSDHKLTGEYEYIGVAGNVEITGGTYDIDVTDYCADGLKAEDNGNGIYGIVENPPVYAITHTMQLKATEPWGMFFNAIVRVDGEVIDYSTLTDYGMYIIAAEDLAGEATADNIIANGKAFTKANSGASVITVDSKDVIRVTYDEELYTYEMDKEFYAVFYVTDKFGTTYGDVNTRSISSVIDQYQEAGEGKYSEQLLALCDKMNAMYDAADAYRTKYTGRYELKASNPDSAASYGFNNIGGGSYTFGHTMQMTSIEPWALIFNCIVRDNGTVVEKENFTDYGVIILSEGDTAPTVQEIRTSEKAKVYSKKNNSATINADGYITVDYTEGIFTADMDKNHYAVFFFEFNGQYYFGNVKTRSMLSVAEQYLANASVYDAVVIDLINAMKELYNATAAYQAKALAN